MVWAGISMDACTELVVPFRPFIGNNFLLMHDNALAHVAYVVRDYLQEVGIRVLPWPARSPNMNHNEHVWDMLERHVTTRFPLPETLQELSLELLLELLEE